MRGLDAISELAKAVGSAGAGNTIAKLFDALAKDDTVALGAAIGGLMGGPLLAAGLLVAGIGGQAAASHRRDRNAREQYEQLAKDIRASGDGVQAIADWMERLSSRNGFLLARLPGYEKAELAQWVAREVERTLVPLLPQEAADIDWAGFDIYLERNHRMLVELCSIAVETRDSVRRLEDGQRTTHEMLLALLERIESAPRALSGEGAGPPTPPPLSDEDRALLEAVKPSADALTRYRIAVAEGDDEAAAQLEETVLRLREARRSDEDFLFERARGDRHLNAGRFDDAIGAYRAASALMPEDPAVLSNLAIALLYSEEAPDYGAALREAEDLLARALKRHQAEGNGVQAAIATTLNNLASVRHSLGRAAEAEPLCIEALEIGRTPFPPADAFVAVALNNLAHLRMSLGRVMEAEPLFVEALEMRRRLFEGDHLIIARGLNNLACVRLSLGRAVEAEQLLVEAAAMMRRLSSDDHPAIALSLHNLARAREALGRPAEAEKLHLEALDMRRRLFRGDHPDIAHSLNSLAGVRESLGRAEEAERLYLKAVDMFRGLFPGDHPDVAMSLNNLAFVRTALSRASEAEPLFVEALDMRRRLCKGDHPDIALSLSNVALSRARQGRVHEAIPLAEEAAAMAGRVWPKDHPHLEGLDGSLASMRRRHRRGGEWLAAILSRWPHSRGRGA